MSDKGKKIIILGNGFDLAHGLPTRYTNFLTFCKKIKYLYSFDGDENNFFELHIKNWEMNQEVKDTIIDAYKQRVIKDSIKDEKKYRNISFPNNPIIEEIYECLMLNTWYVYFTNLYDNNKLIGENWIDFESEISFIIQYIDKTYDNLSTPYNIFFADLYMNKNNKDINSVKLFSFHKSFVEREYNNKNELVSVGENLSTVRNLREQLYNDLERFTRALELYLACFVEKLSVSLKSHDICEINPDYVISFNYTNTYERLYQKNENVFYIHGKCDKIRSIEDNNMVLGIDEYWSENECDNKTNYTIFKKFAQRIRKKTGVENFRYLHEISRIYAKSGNQYTGSVNTNTSHSDGTTIIYVFGHSLDVTDKDALVDFFKHDSTAIIIYCKDKGTEGELIANIIKIIGEKCLLKKVNQTPPKIEFIIQKDMICQI